MSMKGFSSTDPDKAFKRSSHRRNDSSELEVFEAVKYFSGYNEPTDDNYTSYTHKYYNNCTRDENRRNWGLGRRRISLDLPIRSSEPLHHHHRRRHHHQDLHVLEKPEVFTSKEKIGNVKHKQPSSPGGKIASFLNSLFTQSGLKKNKSKSKSTAQARDEEESPGGRRRRRRSSISHLLMMSSNRSLNTASTTTNSSFKSLFSSSSSGFRTPPPCLNTPTKNYKEYMMNDVEVLDKKKENSNKDLTWLDEKLKLIETLSEGRRIWSEDERRKNNGETVGIEDDDGAESDSSSDLFELQNYDLSYGGGLPVYETTNVDSIKKTRAIQE